MRNAGVMQAKLQKLERDFYSKNIPRHKIGKQGLLAMAQSGDIEAEYILAIASLSGHAKGMVLKRALDAAKKFAKSKKDGSAASNVALSYQIGRGTRPNIRLALQWFKKALSWGDIESAEAIAQIYEAGFGGKRYLKQAFHYRHLGARDGDSTCRLNLGSMYEKGEGVRTNLKMAKFWYMKASKTEAIAASNLGFLYLEGLGVRRSVAKAIHFFEMGKAHPKANYMLGRIYLGMEGGKDVYNYKKGIKALSKAAVGRYPGAASLLRAVRQNHGKKSS